MKAIRAGGGREAAGGWKQIGGLVLEVWRSPATHAKGKRLDRSPETAAGTNKAAVCRCISPRVSPGLREAEIRAHPDAGEAVDHLLDRGRVWEVEHERHCGEAQKKVGGVNRLTLPLSHFQSHLFMFNFHFLPFFFCCLKKNTYNALLLTSVGHEDFHCGVLQQVPSGKDGPDLCEQPFPVQSFRVGEDLEDGNKNVVNLWVGKRTENRGRRCGEDGGDEGREWESRREERRGGSGAR